MSHNKGGANRSAGIRRMIFMKKVMSFIKGIFGLSKGPSEYVRFYNAHFGDIDIEH